MKCLILVMIDECDYDHFDSETIMLRSMIMIMILMIVMIVVIEKN